MKRIYYYMLCMAAITLAVSCSEDKTSVNFGIDQRDFQLGPEGGVRDLRISASGRWEATASEPWVLISPANGEGSTTCQIRIDSTLLAGATRTASVRLATRTNEQQLITITQQGFEKELKVSMPEVEIESYGDYNKRFFDVVITSNVKFDIDIPAETPWLTYDKFDFKLERGARPRSTKVRFQWDSNTDSEPREAIVSFATKESEMAHLDKIIVRQGQAPLITDDRKGDSLVLTTIQRNLKMLSNWDLSESMIHWAGVKLWEEGEKGTTEENIGRVRTVQFSFFHLEETLPAEIRHLKYAETISFRSNSNVFMKSLTLGEEITTLKNIKELQLYSIGLVSLPDSFKNLENLEALDLSGNNFNEVPAILTPENFKHLKHLDLVANRRYVIDDLTLMTEPEKMWGGLLGDKAFPEQLLRWDSLEVLRLSNNLIHGTIPDMSGYEKRYSAEDLKRDTLPNVLLGAPKVLPRCKFFAVNLNYLQGKLPDWILYHPYLMDWDPSALIFRQTEASGLDGLPGFSNVPVSPDYYYELYPHKKPDFYE